MPVCSLAVGISAEVLLGKICPIFQGKEQLPLTTLTLLVLIFLYKLRVFQLLENSQTFTDNKCKVLYSQALCRSLSWPNRTTFLHHNPISRRSYLMLRGLIFSQLCFRIQVSWDTTLCRWVRIFRFS